MVGTGKAQYYVLRSHRGTGSTATVLLPFPYLRIMMAQRPSHDLEVS